jgi:hypothetical protein
MAKRNEAAENRPAVRPVRLTSDMSMPKLSAVEIGSYIAAFAGLFSCCICNCSARCWRECWCFSSCTPLRP